MALDLCQPQIARALQNEGWTITASPKHFTAEDNDYFIDLELMRQIQNGTGQTEMRYIEVKCLPAGSARADLYTALGQYAMYVEVLAYNRVAAPVFLAVPTDAYESLFDSVVRQALVRVGVKIVIVDLETETVQRWIEF